MENLNYWNIQNKRFPIDRNTKLKHSKYMLVLKPLEKDKFGNVSKKC